LGEESAIWADIGNLWKKIPLSRGTLAITGRIASDLETLVIVRRGVVDLGDIRESLEKIQ
jgi:hypothetical protein